MPSTDLAYTYLLRPNRCTVPVPTVVKYIMYYLSIIVADAHHLARTGVLHFHAATMTATYDYSIQLLQEKMPPVSASPPSTVTSTVW